MEIFRGLGREAEVRAALEQFRFQVDTLRYGADRLRAHLDRLTLRARHHLATLYDLLLRPFEGRLGARRLVVAPQGVPHYLPLHALYDRGGGGYVVERREVCYTPSASVLRYCFVMGITFRYQLSGLIYASFFDVERLAPRLAMGRLALRDNAIRARRGRLTRCSSGPLPPCDLSGRRQPATRKSMGRSRSGSPRIMGGRRAPGFLEPLDHRVRIG